MLGRVFPHREILFRWDRAGWFQASCRVRKVACEAACVAFLLHVSGCTRGFRCLSKTAEHTGDLVAFLERARHFGGSIQRAFFCSWNAKKAENPKNRYNSPLPRRFPTTLCHNSIPDAI